MSYVAEGRLRWKATLIPIWRDPALFMVVLGIVAAVLLLPPLRDPVSMAPIVPFLSAMALFLLPGVVLSRWALGEHVRGPALLPVAFAASVGIFAVLGVPMMMLGLSMSFYLFAAVVVAGSSIGAGVALASREVPSQERRYGERARVLWVPFGLLTAGLAVVSRVKTPNIYDDMWVYLSYVREFLGGERLAQFEPYFGYPNGLSRLKINGWLLEQAALSRVSGLDAVEMVVWYLNPALVVICMLAIYALARVLFESEAAGVLAACLCAVYFSVHLGASVMLHGSEFAVRLAEDKYAARFLLLPAALMAAVLFVRERRGRYLFFFGFMCWASVGVHPIGYAIIGLSLAGFAVVHLASNWRERASWTTVAALGAAGASVVALPLLLVLAVGVPLADLMRASDISSGDPEVIANMVFVHPERQKILEFADGSYIMHPVLLQDPIILATFFLGVLFLLWRVRRSIAAQLLLGMLVLSTFVVYVPPVATFIGDNLVLPWQIHRLAWVLHLAALLTVCWMVWETVRLAGSLLERRGGVRRLAAFLPAVVVTAATAVAIPVAVAGAWEIGLDNRAGVGGEGVGFDPIYPWLRDNIDEPSVVMAPDMTNTIIPAWSANSNVVSLRGGLLFPVLGKLQERTNGAIQPPQGSLDVYAFYRSTPNVDDKLEILRRHDADYVMATKNSRVEQRFQNVPGVTLVRTPSDSRYNLYATDESRFPE